MTTSKQEKITFENQVIKAREKYEKENINAKKVELTADKIIAAMTLGGIAGGSIGTIIPGVGTAIGGVAGAGTAIVVLYIYGRYKNKKLDKLKTAIEAACEKVVRIVIKDHDALIAVFGPEGLADKIIRAIQKVENEPKFETRKINEIIQNLEKDATERENLSVVRQEDYVASKAGSSLNVFKISSQDIECDKSTKSKEIKGFGSLLQASSASSSYDNSFVFFSPAQPDDEILRGLLLQEDGEHMPVSECDSPSVG